MKSARQICKKQNNELRFFALSSWAEGRGWELHGMEDYFLDICGCLLMDAYSKIAAILFWIETPMQLSTLNGSGWPSWDIQPERFNIRWAGHRPLWRGSKTGLASSSVEAQFLCLKG